MPIRILIYIGLAIIPFFLRAGQGTREPKMELALGLALAICLLALFQGRFKARWNPWFPAILIYLMVSYPFAPPPVELIKANVPNLWAWKPTLAITIFMLMILTISSLHLRLRDRRLMLSIMTWAGVVMSGYVFMQFFGVDQFCIQKPDWYWPNRIGGTMGNRTVVSPFIAMVIPLAIYLRRWWQAVIMFIAVAMCHGQMAVGAMVVSLLFLLGTRGRRRAMVTAGVLVVMSLTLVIGYAFSERGRGFIDDSGRFPAWKATLEDWRQPSPESAPYSHALTGLGVGSFSYVFHQQHDGEFNKPFRHAHNEYLQVLYEMGIIGLVLMLGAMVWVFKKNFSWRDVWYGRANHYRMCLLASFVCISISALGAFVWQLAPNLFYTVVILGLLHKDMEANEVPATPNA